MNQQTLEYTGIEEQVMLAQQGNHQAIEEILSVYQHMVRFRARSFFMTGADQEDLIQEGMIGLFKAIRDFRPEKEIPFRSFAEICINRQLITAIKTSRRLKHQPLNEYLSLNQPTSEPDSNRTLIDMLPGPATVEPEQVVIKRELLRELQGQLRVLLSPFEYEVLNYYVEGYSYKEISSMMNSPTKSIDNALSRIKRKIVAPFSIQNIEKISS